MPKKTNSKEKQLIVVDQNNVIVDIVTQEQLKSEKGAVKKYAGMKLLELTGKQLQVVLTVSYKTKDVSLNISKEKTKKEK